MELENFHKLVEDAEQKIQEFAREHITVDKYDGEVLFSNFDKAVCCWIQDFLLHFERVSEIDSREREKKINSILIRHQQELNDILYD